MSAWSLVGLLIAVRVGAAAARSTTMARRVDAVDEVPNFMKKARPALTRRRLDVGSYSYSYAYDDDFASDSSSSDCVNDDYSTDEYEDSCSEWYDDNPGGCGGYDDSNFASNVQCCACGGGTRCDIVVSGSSLPELHGTYEQKGSCNGYPRWKCDEDGGCDQDQYIWYYSDYSNWHIGPDSCSGSAAIYISDPSADPDEDLAAVSGTWSEWTGSEWQTNSGISVTCAGAYYSYSYSGACTENCIACDGPGYEDCLECESGYAHYDADGDGGGSCWPDSECRGQTACYADGSPCASGEFCNFDNGSGTPSTFGFCEQCSDGPDCNRGLPSEGEADCEACCFGGSYSYSYAYDDDFASDSSSSDCVVSRRSL